MFLRKNYIFPSPYLVSESFSYLRKEFTERETGEGEEILAEDHQRPRIKKLRIPGHLLDESITGNAMNRVSTLCEKQ